MSAGRDQLPPSVLAARNARASDRPTNGGAARAYLDVVAGEDGDAYAAAVQLAPRAPC